MKEISKDEIYNFIIQSLREDVGNGDHTSLACIDPLDISRARLLVKDVGILAGVQFAKMVFQYVDPNAKFTTFMVDGEEIDTGDVAFEVECNTQALLKAERLVLNVMQHLSGVATLSSRFAFEVEGTGVEVLDTRKTTPLMRFLEKWAVRIGGCTNYRDGLYDRIMLKDNHIDACGGITEAIEAVHAYLKEENLNLKITIEVRNLVELYEVMAIGQIDRIMLDNFPIALLKEAVAIINHKYEVEASGGITLNNVRKYAKTGVDFVSSGALTHSAEHLDLSLKIVNEDEDP